MRTITLILALALVALAQTPLTIEEKLGIENASLKLENASLKHELIKVQEEDTKKQAQSVLESACKRAGISIEACQFDQKNLAVSKAVAPAKPEAKK